MRLVRDQEVGGSNPLTPIDTNPKFETRYVYRLMVRRAVETSTYCKIILQNRGPHHHRSPQSHPVLPQALPNRPRRRLDLSGGRLTHRNRIAREVWQRLIPRG